MVKKIFFLQENSREKFTNNLRDERRKGIKKKKIMRKTRARFAL